MWPLHPPLPPLRILKRVKAWGWFFVIYMYIPVYIPIYNIIYTGIYIILYILPQLDRVCFFWRHRPESAPNSGVVRPVWNTRAVLPLTIWMRSTCQILVHQRSARNVQDPRTWAVGAQPENTDRREFLVRLVDSFSGKIITQKSLLRFFWEREREEDGRGGRVVCCVYHDRFVKQTAFVHALD